MSAKAQRNVVAIDLGAESGRVFLCEWDGSRGRLQQVHRFPNGPCQLEGNWFWDREYLWGEILRGVGTAADASSGPIDSIGIDGWAVDYVLLDRSCHPIGRTFATGILAASLNSSVPSPWSQSNGSTKSPGFSFCRSTRYTNFWPMRTNFRKSGNRQPAG
jgi:hypothetical protein